VKDLRVIEELAVRRMHMLIVLRKLNVEVRNPAELAVDVAFLRNLGVVRHPCPFDFVLLKGVELAHWRQVDQVLHFRIFVEKFLFLVSISLMLTLKKLWFLSLKADCEI